MELYYTSIPTSLKELMESNKLKGKRTEEKEDTTISQEVLSEGEEEEDVSLAYVVEEDSEYRKVVAKNIILADIHAKHGSTRRVYGNRKCSVNFCTRCETEKQMRLIEDASSLTYYYSGVPDVNPTVTCSSFCSEQGTSTMSSSSTSSPGQVSTSIVTSSSTSSPVLSTCGSCKSPEQVTSIVTSSSSSSPELVTSSACDTSLEELSTIDQDSNSSTGENRSDSVEKLECPELETVSGIWHCDEAPKDLQKSECWEDEESCHSSTPSLTVCSPVDNIPSLEEDWEEESNASSSPPLCAKDDLIKPVEASKITSLEEDWEEESNASSSPPLCAKGDLIKPVEASKITSLEEDWEEKKKNVSSSPPSSCTDGCRQFFLSDMSAEEILAHLKL